MFAMLWNKKNRNGQKGGCDLSSFCLMRGLLSVYAGGGEQWQLCFRNIWTGNRDCKLGSGDWNHTAQLGGGDSNTLGENWMEMLGL